MKKEHKIWIGIAIAVVAVWWFFLRPKGQFTDDLGAGGGFSSVARRGLPGSNQIVNKALNRAKVQTRGGAGGFQSSSNVLQTASGGAGRTTQTRQTNTSPRPRTQSAAGAPGPIGGGQTSG